MEFTSEISFSYHMLSQYFLLANDFQTIPQETLGLSWNLCVEDVQAGTYPCLPL